MPTRIQTRFRALKEAKARRARGVRHRGRSFARAHARDRGRARTRRCRRHRTGRAVLRSHRRRSRDSGGFRTRAQGGNHVAQSARHRAAIREQSQIPLVLFTYLNPALRYGFEALGRDAKAAGIDGCLLTDLSVEEAEPYVKAMRDAGSRHGVPRCADQHAGALETGRALFHRFRLSGFAHRRHRRARVAFRCVRARCSKSMRAVTDLPHGPGVRHLDSRTGRRSCENGRRRRRGQRLRAPDRKASDATRKSKRSRARCVKEWTSRDMNND